MTWTYAEATDGNVALAGELRSNAGLLALGFATTLDGARTPPSRASSSALAATRPLTIVSIGRY
jgi:glucoamylase